MRLRNRLLWGMLSAWTVLLGLLSCFIYVQLTDLLLHQAEADLNLRSSRHLGMVRSFLGERLLDLRHLATDPAVGSDPSLRAATQAALNRLRDVSQVYAHLQVLSSDGLVLIDSNQLNLGERSAHYDPLNPTGLFIHQNGLGSQHAGITVALPRGGWLVATVPFQRVSEFLQLKNNPQGSLRLRLIDDRSIVAYDSHDRATIGQPHVPGDESYAIEGESIGPLLTNGKPWTLEISRPRADILIPVHHIIWTILAAIPVGLGCGTLVILWLAHGLSRPLVALATQVQDLGSGGWRKLNPSPVPRGASLEVQILHREIGHLTSHLQEQFRHLEQTRMDLLHKEEQLRLALENSGVGLWDWHIPSGRVDFSDTWFSMLGYTPGSQPATVATWSDMVHPDDLPEVMTVVQRHLAGVDPLYRTQHRCRHADGRWIWMLDAGRVVQRAADGSAERMIGTHVDISSMKLTELKLTEARVAAEQAAQAKDDFLATMSHEIRTPMNGVLGLNGVLLGTSLDAEQRDLAETVQRSGEALLAILNDVLDLARMDAGKLNLFSEPVDLQRAARDVVALFRGQAAAKGLQLTISCAEVVPLALADRNRIRQALINLVSNAIKFTDHGLVAIRIGRHDERLVRIEVTDTGIGIPSDRLERLFQPFSQVESGLSRRFGGAGLGLIISQRLVEGMGGTIGVTTEVAVGSVFTILLPVAPTGSVQHTTSIIGNRKQGSVLVANGSPIGRRMTALLLQQLGLESVIVENGRSALETWRQGDFSAVLLEHSLPELNGEAVTQSMRAAELVSRRTRTPIIGLITEDLPELRKDCLIAGMDDALATPLTVASLRQALSNWMLVSPT